MAKFKTETRVIRNAGPRRTLSLPAIPKAVGRLPTESGVEYAGLLEMSFDRDMKALKVQPRTFELLVDGKTSKYTPDAEYVRRNGVVGYREFKQSVDELDEETASLLAAASQQISAQGYEFSVRDLRKIRSGHRLDNIRLLRRYSRTECPEGLSVEIVRLVAERPGISFGDLRECVGPARLPALMRLLWEQRLTFDMTGEPLGQCTRIQLGDTL